MGKITVLFGHAVRWAMLHHKQLKTDAAVVLGALVAQPIVHDWVGRQHGLAATLIALFAGAVGVTVRTVVKP